MESKRDNVRIVIRASKQINFNDKSILKDNIHELVINPLRKDSSISKLYLARTRLRGGTLKILVENIKGHSGLSNINLRENALGKYQQVFGLLVGSFPNLTQLDLNQTQLAQDGVIAMSQSLQRLRSHSKLAYLDLGFNQLQDAGLLPFLEAIAHEPTVLSPKVWDLRMSGNLLTDKTANFLIKLLEEGRLFCKKLLLDNNPQISQKKLAKLAALVKPTSVSPSVAPATNGILDLSNKDFTANQMQLITVALRQNPTVRQLNLSSNQLNDASSLSILWDAINTQGQIEALDLSHNNIGPEGAKAIADGLAKDQGLVRLKLSGNQLGEKGGCNLCNAIAKHGYLREIELDANHLKDAGVSALAEALIGHPSLVSLNLQSNYFANQGGVALLRLFQQNGALQRENKEVPLHKIGLSKEPGLTQVLYEAIQAAVRLYGHLPYQRSLYSKPAALIGHRMLELDFEKTLLGAIEDFIRTAYQKSASSLNTPDFLEAYKHQMVIWRTEGIANARAYLKERCSEETLQTALAKATPEFDLECQVYSNPETLTTWFDNPEEALRELQALQVPILKEYEALQDKLTEYTESIATIDAEMAETAIWGLLLTPMPVVLPVEGFSAVLPKPIAREKPDKPEDRSLPSQTALLSSQGLFPSAPADGSSSSSQVSLEHR